MDIIWKCYASKKRMYQLYTCRFKNLLVHYPSRYAVGPSFYFSPQQHLSNRLSSKPNKDHMEKLFPWEVDVWTYQFKVHKTISVSFYSVMIRVHDSWRQGVICFHYFILCETFPTTFWFTQIENVTLLTILLLSETLPMVPWVSQMEIICKSYSHGKLTSQHTMSGFTKLLMFPLLGSFLGYTILKGMFYILLNIVLLGTTFLMVFRVTTKKIVSKNYSLDKMMY